MTDAPDLDHLQFQVTQLYDTMIQDYCYRLDTLSRREGYTDEQVLAMIRRWIPELAEYWEEYVNAE